ncbi:MAG: hypothetical protein UV73_C0006G0046 [Candidatus Gottesmanbacteria bacterium GW2011_GWA2_43_14]|uniref:Cohesin domain-containing protein n=1 Tax=Candidatus Gottesmanbacteria bacterium GW2011_GWA2_43_14 TaxID=1618443 RepID=A0A0G1DJD4_9BACT|nr:MAG: hypothetical protein UV73_C0006G0046 [Candidatus Gottesmanbacteria bacterium GW2011_GWA2_43_14]
MKEKRPVQVKTNKLHPWFYILILFAVPVFLLLFLNRSKNANFDPELKPVILSFKAEKTEVTNETLVTVLADSGKEKVAFARLNMSFDPQELNITQIEPGGNLSTTIDETPLEKANTEGTVILVMGASPGSKLPSGKFQLASIKFMGGDFASGRLNFNPDDMQIVTDNVEELKPEIIQLR